MVKQGSGAEHSDRGSLSTGLRCVFAWQWLKGFVVQGLLYVRGQSVLDITFSKSFFNLRNDTVKSMSVEKIIGLFFG